MLITDFEVALRSDGMTLQSASDPAEPEPGQHIASVGCPCCGKRIRIEYGDDPGDIGAVGPI